jgi:hypothetical protein
MNALDILFTIIWIVVVFVIVRFLGERYFNSPEKYRADVAAAAIVIAFVIGLLWPFANHAVSTAPPATQTAVVTPPPICHTPRPHYATVLHGTRRAQGGDYGGSIDSLLPDPTFPTSQTQFRIGCTIYANGWVANVGAKTPVPGIGFLIDSKRLINVSPSYGNSRPDVARALGASSVVFSGFSQAEIPTTGLRPGTHTIQIVALSKDGKSYHTATQPETITLQ